MLNLTGVIFVIEFLDATQSSHNTRERAFLKCYSRERTQILDSTLSILSIHLNNQLKPKMEIGDVPFLTQFFLWR